MSALATLKAKLQPAVSVSPIILMLMAYLDTLIFLVYGQTPESSRVIEKKAAQTVLIWIEYAEAAAAKTPTPLDDSFLNEIHQACELISAA